MRIVLFFLPGFVGRGSGWDGSTGITDTQTHPFSCTHTQPPQLQKHRELANHQNKNPNPPLFIHTHTQSLTDTPTKHPHDRELANHLDKAQEDMSPLRVYDLFKKITDEDAVVLWLNPK